MCNKNYLTIKYFDEVTSTNDLVKEDITFSDNPLLYIANKQTKGKGRKGHTFYSPTNGLYFSIGFKVLDNNPLYTIAACVAVCETLAIFCKPSIKWVNDIFVNNKKVCGILTEGISNTINGPISHVVIGIGINLCYQDFPDDLKEIAGDIGVDRSICNNKFKEKLATKISNRLLELITLPKKNYLSKYKNLLFILGKKATYKQGDITVSGIASSINEMGNLIINTDDNIEVIIDSGEVIFK